MLRHGAQKCGPPKYGATNKQIQSILQGFLLSERYLLLGSGGKGLSTKSCGQEVESFDW
jgi:hypothetical protein